MIRRVVRSLVLATLGLLPLRGSEPPRLAIAISIDQFRADYLERFRPYFVEGGFNRLLGGAVYTDCHHRHASTNTANGHTTLMTGVHAEFHGIIANEWLDRDSLQVVGAVADPDSPLVGATPSSVRTVLDLLAGNAGASPRRLLSTTVGDQVKLRHGTDARVIAISNKDRAAILMGGRLADCAYWLNRGRFVTSKYYRDTLPDWAEAFNREGRVERDFGREWTRLLDAKEYDSVQGPDDAPGEESRLGLGTTFPRRVDGGETKLSDKFYEAYRLTPFSNELLGQFAEATITGEQLGRHKWTDLLCVSFSQTDYCGHSYGPDSHEIMDSVLRLDRVFARFLTFLDREIGAGKYTIVLSADHGVCPLPERVLAYQRGVTAGRFDAPKTDAAVEAALTAEFGAPEGGRRWAIRDSNGYRFRPDTLAAKQVSAGRAAAVAQAALAKLPQIAAVFTRAELLAAPAEGNLMIAAVRRSYNAERSQDLVYILQPYVVDRSPAGTNHSTPYDYDNHVPLLWYGAGVTPGVHVERVGTDQLAPTLSALIGVPRPPQSRAERLF